MNCAIADCEHVPQQLASSVVCGFYVMRFIKDLINDFFLQSEQCKFLDHNLLRKEEHVLCQSFTT